MKIKGFTFTPKASIEFTEAEVKVLKVLCEHHYDSLIRSLVPPGRGAIINGLVNSLHEGVAEWPLTNDQVQMLAKACEMTTALPVANERELGISLYWGLVKVIQRLNEEWARVNPELVA